jgi:hypothetical protein
MGVTPEKLAELYPRLYHMAEPDSWESIRDLGLLSTSSLLDRFGITGEIRRTIELCRRDRSHQIKHEKYGRAVIRDQLPIIESKLRASLQDCSPEEWYAFLNGRVFFWLCEERLRVLLGAKTYRNKIHRVLTLETLPLAQDYIHSIMLSPMNSGNTLPIAQPRGLTTLKSMNDYPFEQRLRLGPYYTVVELAVEGGIPNILDYTIQVDEMVSDGSNVTKSRAIFKR